MKLFTLRKIAQAVLLIALAALVSCNYRVEKKTPPRMETKGVTSFEIVRSMVFETHCTVCHSNIGEDPLTDYAAVRNLADQIFRRIEGLGPERKMPPASAPQLSESQIRILDQWYKAGAPEKPTPIEPTPLPSPSGGATPSPSPSPVPIPSVEPSPSPGPVDPELNFSNVMAQVLAPKCVGCHDLLGEADLSDYAEVKSRAPQIKRRILKLGPENPMPPLTKPPLTDEELNFLLKWIDAGAPQ